MYTIHSGEEGKLHSKFLLCLVLSRLIEDALDCLTPDLLAFLNAKLTRRLVKLNDDRDRASPHVLPVYELMFATLDPLFPKLTKKANERLEMVWNDFKKRIQRPIHLLPRHVDQAHLILTLLTSGLYLKQVLSWYVNLGSAAQSFAPHRLQMEFDVSAVTTNKFRAFADRCFSLSEL